MSSDLHQQLADLAGDAPAPTPGGARALWAAGKRRQRRRTAMGAGAIVACLLVVVGAVGLFRPTASTVGPTDGPDSPGALPTQLHIPSRWLPGTDGHPIGPLAVVASAERGWSGETSYVGVSATTGEYRFLDLPGLAGSAGGDEPALSPSGRYLAYWLGGDPDGDAAPVEDGRPVVGVAVYDTVTGDAHKEQLRTEHGLQPVELLWADEDRIYLQAGQVHGTSEMDRGSSEIEGDGWFWEIGSGEVRQVDIPGAAAWGAPSATDGFGRLLFAMKGKQLRYLLVDPDRQQESLQIVPDGIGGTELAVRPDGVLAGLTGTPEVQESPNTVTVVEQGTGTEIRGPKTWDVVWWARDKPVIQEVMPKRQDGNAPTRLALLDPATGTTTGLVSLPDSWQDGYLNIHGFATDLLLTAPMERPEPPGAFQRFWLVGGVALASFVALAIGLLRWQGRRPRVRG